MKTAVSIPDPVFEKGEALARKLGLSRSALYALAIEEIAERLAQEYPNVDPVTARIDAYWAKHGVKTSKLDAPLRKSHARMAKRNVW
jgi:hypothetical protein